MIDLPVAQDTPSTRHERRKTPQWKTDTKANMTKIIDRLLDLQGQGRRDSEALQSVTEARFHQVQQMNLNNSQCYRALIQSSGKVMTGLNHTVRNLVREHDIIADKLDFVVQCIQRAYEEAERIR